MVLLFDLDNTLLDDFATKKYYLPKLYMEFSQLINSDYETFSDNWVKALEKYYKLYTQGNLAYKEQREERIKSAFVNSQLGENEIGEVINSFDKYLKKSWKLFDGWSDFFESSKLERAIVTNGNEQQQNEKIEELGLKEYFKDIFISEQVGWSKPNPLIFKHVCDSLSVQPTDCIFIGDSYYYDIAGSMSVGMKAYWINHKNETHCEKANGMETFQTIHDLIGKLKRIEQNL